MSLISRSIPNLVNGVSQQPAALRLPSQGEVQINGLSSAVDGLHKRPPFRHIKTLLAGTPLGQADAAVHTIDRDSTERYTVILQNSFVRVYDMNGVAKTVTPGPYGWGYLNTASPRFSLTAMTVNDYTFIVNRDVVVAKDTPVAAARPFEALIFCRAGNYATTYTVFVNGSPQASITTPAPSSAGDAQFITTSYIAAQLASQLFTNLSPFGFGVVQVGSTIYLNHTTSDFAIQTSDGAGDQMLKVAKDKVQRFSDLPAKGYPGFTVRVQGDIATATDDYYIQYEAGSGSDGIWKEVPKPGIQTAFNPATMPHALVRQADGTFLFTHVDWNARPSGDDDSNPFPSFVGKQIWDIFFFRNRLGVIADEQVVLTRAGKFFNWWKESAIQVLDTDPIDIAVSHVKASQLRAAVPFNETLLLFSERSQFQAGRADALTAKTISLNQTTDFESSQFAKPVGAGSNIYFAFRRGDYSGIREYFVNSDTETEDAAIITQHVPALIPGEALKITASTNESMIAVLTNGATNKIYVYRYLWAGADKLQSSWSEWVLPTTDTILDVQFVQSDLYLVVSRADGVHLEVASLNPGRPVASTLAYPLLDRLVTETQVTDSTVTGSVLGFRMPYAVVNPSDYVLVVWDDDPFYPKGTYFQCFYDAGSGLMTVNGNPQKFRVGRTYTFQWRFSTLYLPESSDGGGTQAVRDGRLQLRNVDVAFSNTGYMRAVVTPRGRSAYTYVMTGSTVGVALAGNVALSSGTFRIPVLCRNEDATIDILNDQWLPNYLLSAEWEGFFTMRSRRV